MNEGKVDRPYKFPESFVQFAALWYEFFHLPYRQLEGALRKLGSQGKPVLITDGGPWYKWPARRFGLKHIVQSGRDRNYIERWFETFKDRLRNFDKYFPTKILEKVQDFCHAFGFFYNKCRPHQSMKGPPSGGKGGLKAWAEMLIFEQHPAWRSRFLKATAT